MKKKKKPNLCTRITRFSLIVTVMAVIVWIALFKANSILGADALVSSKNSDIEDYDFSNEPKKDNLSVLFAGVDEDGLRTDSIIYAKYDTVNNKLYMMSIPRDTYTTNDLATYKINSIYYGGKHTKEFVKEVENLLDVSIDYYAVIDLKLIPKVVEQIGELDITLDDEVWKLDKNTNKWNFFLPAGKQTLNAEQVETLARNRDYADGDISRGKMQRKIMIALIQNLMSTKNVLKLPKVASTILDNTNTNVTLREAMKYVTELKEIDTSSIVSTSIPLENIAYNVNGVACVLVDKQEARRIVAEDWIYTPPAATTTTQE